MVPYGSWSSIELDALILNMVVGELGAKKVAVESLLLLYIFQKFFEWDLQFAMLSHVSENACNLSNGIQVSFLLANSLPVLEALYIQCIPSAIPLVCLFLVRGRNLLVLGVAGCCGCCAMSTVWASWLSCFGNNGVVSTFVCSHYLQEYSPMILGLGLGYPHLRSKQVSWWVAGRSFFAASIVFCNVASMWCEVCRGRGPHPKETLICWRDTYYVDGSYLFSLTVRQ